MTEIASDNDVSWTMEYSRSSPPPEDGTTGFGDIPMMHLSPPPAPPSPVKAASSQRQESTRSEVTLVRKPLGKGNGQVGEFGVGVGLRCDRDAITGNLVVTSLLPNGPAAESGLIKIGDALESVNGFPVSEMTHEHVGQLLLGAENTSLFLVLTPNEFRGSSRSDTIVGARGPPKPLPRASRAPHIQPPVIYQPSPAPPASIVPLPRPSPPPTADGVAEPDRAPDLLPQQLEEQNRKEQALQQQLSDQQRRLAQQQQEIEALREARAREEEAEERLRVREMVLMARQKKRQENEEVKRADVGIPDTGSIQSPALSPPRVETGGMVQGNEMPPSVDGRKSREAPGDAEGAPESPLLSQLKANFQQRMNDAIKQQRERMRALLNDVDTKIVTLKSENLAYPSAMDDDSTKGSDTVQTSSTANGASPISLVSEKAASSGESLEPSPNLSAETNTGQVARGLGIQAEVAAAIASPLPASAANHASSESADFKPRNIEGETERLMREMSALRAELKAAVNASPGQHRGLEASTAAATDASVFSPAPGQRPMAPQLLGEAELPAPLHPKAAQDVNGKLYTFDGKPLIEVLKPENLPLPDTHSALMEVAVSEAPKLSSEQQRNFDTLSESSKQKFLDIVDKLQQESNRASRAPPPLLDPVSSMASGSLEAMAVAVDESCASVSDDGSDNGESSPPPTKGWRRDAMPTKGCLHKGKIHYPVRPVTPPKDPNDPRLTDHSKRRSILGASVAAAVEVLNPGLKTPYSPDHVMSPHGPMIVAEDGLLPPLEHPFVQEQMYIINILKQKPDLADKPAEVVKALSLRAELLGPTNDVLKVQYEDARDEGEASRPKAKKRGIKFDSSVAQEDGDSATRLHLEAMVKRNLMREEMLRQRQEMMLMLQHQMLQQQLAQAQAQDQYTPKNAAPHQKTQNQVYHGMPAIPHGGDGMSHKMANSATAHAPPGHLAATPPGPPPGHSGPGFDTPSRSHLHHHPQQPSHQPQASSHYQHHAGPHPHQAGHQVPVIMVPAPTVRPGTPQALGSPCSVCL